MFFFGVFAVIAAACLKDKSEPQSVVIVTEEQFLKMKTCSTAATEQEQELPQSSEFAVASKPPCERGIATCPVCGQSIPIEKDTMEVVCPNCGKKLRRKVQ